jgi:hypothetical protein
MKKILKYSVLCIALGAFTLTSCKDFLDVMPTGKRTEQQAYGNLEEASLIVAGLYDLNLQTMRGGQEYQITLLGTDEMRTALPHRLGGGYDNLFGAWDSYEPQFNGSNAASVLKPWGLHYKVITEANKVINALKGNEAENMRKLSAEARFIRGLNMFKLSVMWGDIAITDTAFAAENGYERQPQNVVWQFIIDDFRYAVDNLPDTQGDDWSLATKYAALAMLGKSLMYVDESTGLRDFEAADACFTEIINSSKFGLVSDYKDLWNNVPFEYPDNPSTFPLSPEMVSAPDFKEGGKSESIFTINFRRPGSDDSYINIWQWEVSSWEAESWFGGEKSYIAGHDAIALNTFMYEDKNSTPDTFVNYEYPDPVLGPQPVDFGVGVWEDGDLRFDASIRYIWRYYTNMYKQQPTKSFGTNNLPDFLNTETELLTAPYMWITIDERKTQLSDNMRQTLIPTVKKYEDYRVDQYVRYGINSMFRTHKPFPFIRYADILLLHAECLSEMGRLGEAITEVEKVRARAWGSSTPPAWNPGSTDEFRRMVMDERMRELCFEGWRRADLIRTGLFVELVSSRNDWAIDSPGYVTKDKEHWPIPGVELIENADAWGWVQNPGYSE